MAGRVDEVEDVVLAILGAVIQAHGLGLDGDAALALDVHRIEHLLLHVAQLEPAGLLDQAVGKRRLAVVDMGDDGEIADVGEGRCHSRACSRGDVQGQARRFGKRSPSAGSG